MRLLRTVAAGLSACGTVYGVRAVLRRGAPAFAPRIHEPTEAAIAYGLALAGRPRLTHNAVRGAAVATDVVADAVYFSLVGLGPRRGSWLRGLGFGLGAGAITVGLSALEEPGPRGLLRRPYVPLITFALYAVAGLVAGVVSGLIKGGTETASYVYVEEPLDVAR